MAALFRWLERLTHARDGNGYTAGRRHFQALDLLIAAGAIQRFAAFGGAKLGAGEAFAAGAMAASLLFFFALGYGARMLRPLFANPRAWQVLDGLIGLTMLGLACKLVLQS